MVIRHDFNKRKILPKILKKDIDKPFFLWYNSQVPQLRH